MAMSSSGRGKLSSEINVTPLVDVMLVLLVIFMITTPMLNTGVDISLPETEGQVLDESEGKLILSISSARQVFLGATQIAWADLEAKLSANERVRREQELWIEADAALPYRVVVTAMAAARKAGVRKMQLLTDPTAVLDLSELDNESKAAKPEGQTDSKP